MKKPVQLLEYSSIPELTPTYASNQGLDLVVIRYDKTASVLYGRCHHRGALLSDGYIDGPNLMCGLHHWDYRYDTGISEYNNDESLHKFQSEIIDDYIYIDEKEIQDFLDQHPQPFNEDEYLGKYMDTSPEETEPYTNRIKSMSREGIGKQSHGPIASMGVDRRELPQWNDIQYLPAQLWKAPLLENEEVETSITIGQAAKKPLKLDIPIFVSDMSFGAISKEAKIALATGAELAGTGICSGEGGMLDEEQQANSKYFYELASAKFGFEWDKLKKVQAFHFKAGQGAKTGVGGHLPGNKVSGDIAKTRNLEEGQDAISPNRFEEMTTVEDFRAFAQKVREYTGGIPIGFKMSAAHIEKDIDFALEVGVDYIILDGRGGATGAAPTIIRDHIDVHTIPALARARKHLDSRNASDVSLIITGGLRVPEDFVKALMLGADAIAVANSALQAIGCLGMRACSSNNCPVGIATMKDHLRARLVIDASAQQLCNFFDASTHLMKIVARACGYDDFQKFRKSDLSTHNYDMHRLTGISYAGFADEEQLYR